MTNVIRTDLTVNNNLYNAIPQNKQSQLDKALELRQALKTGCHSQEELMRLFVHLNCNWQEKAMHLLWEAHGKPLCDEYGREAICKSAYCLLDPVGNTPSSKSIIDLLIDHIIMQEREKEFDLPKSKEHVDLKMSSLSSIEKMQWVHKIIQEEKIHPGEDLPVLHAAADNLSIELHEQSIDAPSHREAFHHFLLSLQNAQLSHEKKIEKFFQLDPQLQSFLAFVVGVALDAWQGEEDGRKRILKHPEVLMQLTNRSGIDVLRQINTRFEIQSAIEMLSALKNILLQKSSDKKTILGLKLKIGELFQKIAILKPFEEKLLRLIEEIEKDTSQDKDKGFKKLCHQLLHARVAGSKQCLIDDWIGMLRMVKWDYSLQAMRWRLTAAYETRYESIIPNPTPSRSVDKTQVLAERFDSKYIGSTLNVLMIAYECARFGLKCGGLGEAVYGMAKGLASRGHHVTVLLPKFDQLPKTITQQLHFVETISHPYCGAPKEERVLGFETQNISLRYLEDTPHHSEHLDHYALSSPQSLYEDGILKDKEEPWVGLKERMAYFSNAAAEYIMAHKEEIDVAVLHDWHAAYSFHQIVWRYFDAWSQGKTPSTVFVIHNNNYECQGVYGGRAAQVLCKFGDFGKGRNVMLDALQYADHIVTVSPSFSTEIQESVLGAGIDPWLRRHAHQDRVSGITNGSNPDLWNPAENEVLKNWIDPVTKEPVPLNYHADDPDILEKKKTIKIQLQKALEIFYPEEVKKYRLNVKDKDLILYVGRYDSSQKGIDKFTQILHAAHEKDAAFITMGAGEDGRATQLLDHLEQEAMQLGNAWITRGKEGASLRMQLGDKEKQIPALGPLLRATAIYNIIPSSFEPCGLVQFEAWLFGVLVIASCTGGLADTLNTDASSPEFNGFTFERLANWESETQNIRIYETTLKAIDYYRTLNSEQKTALMHKVMKNAKLSSWTSAPEGLTPIEQYENVFLSAIQTAKQGRGYRTIDLTGADAPPAVSEDGYFGKGRNERLYESFGAHPVWEENKIVGVKFRVMAPGATSVSVAIINGIEETLHPMKALDDGSWETFLEGATIGTVYEYEIVDGKNFAMHKADPFAIRSELRPKHASVVDDATQFIWNDKAWIDNRTLTQFTEKPLNIYEVHLGSWRRRPDGSFKNYRELAIELAEYAQFMEYTHVELLGILEHPSDSSWGYQVSGFFAPTSRHGTIEDFQFFVNYLHECNLGIILDFVPYHFSGNEWSLRAFGGQKFFESGALYNGESPGWGTRVFDLERQDVRNFLLSSAHFFLSNHIDGLRVDAVSALVSHIPYDSRPWTANKEGTHWNEGGIAFMRELNEMAHAEFPGTVIHAENSRDITETKIDTDPIENDGLGFDRRWYMNWMHHSLRLLSAPPENKSQEFYNVASLFQRDWQMKHILSISHDEVVHLKGSLYEKAKGSQAEKLAQVRTHQSLQAFFPADGILNIMGNEFAQTCEWNFEKQLEWSLLNDPAHYAMLTTTQAINAFYKKHSAFWSAGVLLSRFEWINSDAEALVLSYHRKDAQGKRLTIVHNFSQKTFQNYPLSIKIADSAKKVKSMKIIFNTDRKEFGGSGAYDAVSKVKVSDVNLTGFDIPLPAYSTLVLKEKFQKIPKMPIESHQVESNWQCNII